MFSRRQRKTGFTLVEILIVVVILGILAAVVIPQFTNASEDARSSSLLTQLQTLRSQLELYQVQHNGDYPTLAQLQANWTVMTDQTDSSGVTPPPAGTANPLGPYLQQPPSNAFEDGSTTVIGLGGAAAGIGWEYDATTGAIRAVMEQTKYDEVFDVTGDGAGDFPNDIVAY